MEIHLDHAATIRKSVMALAWLSLFAGAAGAATTLARTGYSIPAGGDVAGAVGASAQCQVKNRVVILPPVAFDPASSVANSGQLPNFTSAVPDEAEAYLRLRLRIGNLDVRDHEKIIGDSVTRMVARLPIASPQVKGLLIEIDEFTVPELVAQFTLANIIVKAKGTKSDLKAVLHFAPGFIARHGDLLKKLAVYADGFGTNFHPRWSADADWIAKEALNKPLYLRLDLGPAMTSVQVKAGYLEATLAIAGSSVELLWIEARDTQTITSVCALSSLLSRYVKPESTVMQPDASPFRIAVEGVDRSEHRMLAGAGSPDITIVARAKAAAGRPRTITLAGPAPGQYELECHDPISGAKLTMSTGAAQQLCVSESEYALIFARKLGKPEERIYSAVEVKGRADLKVEEIIARWQAYRESQRRLLESYIAECFMSLHFDSTSIGSGFDVSMRFKQFSNRAGLIEWAQTEFYVNGVKFKKQREFPLPQLEPEKVMSQPLEMKLDEKYSYKLDGVETVDGVLSYVVGVEPRESGETLYSGKIWIDGTTYRQVKMELRQRGTKGNIVSNVETQSYGLVPDGKGNDLNLIKSIYAHQILNAAGRNFTLQKNYRFSDHLINPPDFDGQLAATRSSDFPMYRETDTGLHALRKKDGERVVEEVNKKRIRTLVGGALYEGTFNFPIPLFGLSLVDFRFRNTDTQLSMFFAGPILAANFSRQWKGRFRLGLDMALSAIPESNRVYSGNTEVKKQNLWLFEEGAGVRMTWQSTTSLSITGTNHVVYDLFRSSSDFDKQYVLPRNGVTLIPGVEIKYARKGYNVTLNGSQGRRLGWTQFGYTQAPREPFHDVFSKYSAEFSKTFYLTRFTKAGWDFDYYGGDRLDRFSRYRPSFFSRPRIRGIPNGTDSFDAIALGSVNYGFNVMEMFKFEGYYNYARARNLAESRRFQKFDGLQMDFGTAGPWGTYMQGTVTYALHGNVNRYNSRWGVYFMIFKPLR